MKRQLFMPTGPCCWPPSLLGTPLALATKTSLIRMDILNLKLEISKNQIGHFKVWELWLRRAHIGRPDQRHLQPGGIFPELSGQNTPALPLTLPQLPRLRLRMPIKIDLDDFCAFSPHLLQLIEITVFSAEESGKDISVAPI